MKSRASVKDTEETKSKKRWLLPVIVMVSTLIVGGVITLGFTSGKVQAFVKNWSEEKMRKQTAETVFGDDQELITLKQELISQTNKSLGKPVIDDIFITNIIMQ